LFHIINIYKILSKKIKKIINTISDQKKIKGNFFSMSDNNLTRDDLILLMDSYRNHFAMNQTLLSQLTKLVDQQTHMIKKCDIIISKQSQTCSGLEKATLELKDSNSKIDGMQNKIVERVDNHNLSSVKDHNSLKNKIYLGWIGMGTIILSLLGLIMRSIKII